jgi:hypothetical protein
MKFLFSFTLFMFSIAANADITKPANTMDMVTGVTIINETQFDYRARDRGWMTSGNLTEEKVSLVADKTFILEYMAQSSVDKAKAPSLWKAVRADAEKTCLKFGQTEYAGQIAKLDQGYKTALVANIENSSKDNDSGYVALTAICMVEVTATK